MTIGGGFQIAANAFGLRATALPNRTVATKTPKTGILQLLAALGGVVLVLCLPPASIQQAHAQSNRTVGENAVNGESPEAPRPQGQNSNGMHIYIWAGLKSHPPGRHDYPQFLADWSKLLTEHGAVVDGALHAPNAADLEHTDVIIIYKGDAGYLSDSEKAVFETYVKRGGGIVNLHDSLCGPDPEYFASLVGAGKKHGEVNYTNPAPVAYTIVDKSDPIMQGMSNFTIMDEAFYKMTWAKDPGIHVLATSVIVDSTTLPAVAKHAPEYLGKSVPQIWTYEHTVPGGVPARAFVWMQGDNYQNFSNYQIEHMLLRGIAWAGKQPVDSLVDYFPPPSPRRSTQSAPGMQSPPGN